MKGTAAIVGPHDADSEDEEVEVDATEWTWRKSIVSCPWAKEMKSTYNFDIKKADKIFDLLLEKNQLKLSSNHVIPSAGKLKGKRYCKFHNATTHSTNECSL